MSLAPSSSFLALDSSARPLFRRRFSLTLKPRLKTDLRKKLVCRAKATETAVGPAPSKLNTDDLRLLSVGPRNTELKTIRTAVPRSSSSESQGVDGTKFLVGGAAAAALAAAGIQLGQQVVHAVDSVPAIAHLELLLGTAVTAKSILSYLGDRRTRAKVDAKLTSLLNTLNSAFGKGSPKSQKIEGSKTKTDKSGARKEPAMLEVELRSLVDSNQAKVESQLAVAVDRPTFIGSVADFIRTRERKTLEVQELMEQSLDSAQAESKRLLDRQEVEGEVDEKDTTEAIKQSLLELEKSKSSRRSRASGQAAAAITKLQQVQAVQQQIKEEKSKGLKEVTGLRVELGSLSASAKELTQRAERERRKLSSILGVTGFGNDADVAGPSPELEGKLQDLRKLQRSISTDGSTEVALPRTKMAALQEKLTSLEMQLQVVSESRDTLLQSNAELHRRVARVTQEKHVLAVRVHELEGTLAKTQKGAVQGVTLGRRVLALESEVKGRRKAQWNKQASLEEELRVARESQSKYQGAIKWLTLQIQESQDLAKESQFRSSLEFAEKRAQQEDERVADIQAKIRELDFKTMEKQSVLSDRVAELESKATQLAPKDSSSPLVSTPLRPSTASAASGRSSTISSSGLLTAPALSSAAVAEGPLHAYSGAAASAAEWLKNVSAKMQEGKRRGKEPLIPPMTVKQLKTYARAIAPAYVPRNGEAEERAQGQEMLIKDLVKKGADEEWARDLVLNGLFASGSAQSKGKEKSTLG